MELPHHPGQKSAGPIGPQLSLMTPLAADGVDRKEIRIPFDERGDLALGKLKCQAVSCCPRFFLHHRRPYAAPSSTATGMGVVKQFGGVRYSPRCAAMQKTTKVRSP